MRVFNFELMLTSGEQVESDNGNWSVSINLATKQTAGGASQGNAEEVDQVMAAAQAAWSDWAALTSIRGRSQ